MKTMVSKMWNDIQEMHQKFMVYKWYADATLEERNLLLGLRLRMLSEEYNETMYAVKHGDAEEMIDGLIDLIVIAIGTLDIMHVDVDEAWNEVMKANMSKEVGVKPSRPNPLGLPDLIKPEGWEGPYHRDNDGWEEIDRVMHYDDYED